MQRKFSTLLCALWILIGAGSLFAQVAPAPSLLNFQGRLARPDGTPVSNGNYSITFSLWTAATGGVKKWEQTLNPVTVRNGTFAILLNVDSGFHNGATATNLFDMHLWLEIKLGSNPALTPRQQLVSVAYAMKANTVPDNVITSAKIANGAVTNAKIQSVEWSKITGIPADSLTLPFAGTGVANAPDYLFSLTNTGTGQGLYSEAPDGAGVYGKSTNFIGVFGESANGSGVYGFSNVSAGVSGISNTGWGVYGNSSGNDYAGVYGVNQASGPGVEGFSANNGLAVYGHSEGGMGVAGVSVDNFGVYGISTNHIATYGFSQNNDAIFGITYSTNALIAPAGVKGIGPLWGVRGESDTGTGVFGRGAPGVHGYSNTGGTGVYGISYGGIGTRGISDLYNGVYGVTSGGGAYAGVYGQSNGANSNGVIGECNNGSSAYGVWGKSSTGWGVRSSGPAGGTTGWSNVSDARYKTHIQPLANALDAILSLRGVTFEWKRAEYADMNFTQGKHIGFIAQEVEQILPELVMTDGTGYKSVTYSNLVPVLVEAVKTLKQQNDHKDAEIAELKARFEQLAADVAELKSSRK